VVAGVGGWVSDSVPVVAGGVGGSGSAGLHPAASREFDFMVLLLLL
jgi:hypothetical protein